MKLSVLIALFLVVSACGPDLGSRLAQREPMDYSDTLSGVKDTEEVVITFVGARKGYLVDKSIMSMFNTDVEVYMNVALSNSYGTSDTGTSITSFGNTKELKMSANAATDLQHKSGKQIILSGKRLNSLLAQRDTLNADHLFVRFYENGLGIDGSNDLLTEHKFYISPTSSSKKGGLNEIINLARRVNSEEPAATSNARSMSFYLTSGNTKAEFEFSIEIRKAEKPKNDLQDQPKPLDIRLK